MKKKIMHLLASNSYSGAENVVCTIIDNCSDKYDMYYCSPNGPIKDVLEKRNIKFIPLKRLSILELKKIIKDYNIDIIHAHDYKASFISVFLKIKTISQLHVNWHFNSNWNIYTVAYRAIMNKFSKIIVVSKEIRDCAVFAKGNEDKFTVLTNVVDKREVLKKSDEFESASYDLVFVGRLAPVKRPEMIIYITKRLKEKYPLIKTCIIGSGELEEKCRELIKTYNLEKNIDMLGFKSNPFPYIKNSKVAILPSLHEGLPMSVIECMILGVPVLNGGVDGLATLFKKYPDFICSTVDEYCKMIDLILSGKKDLSKYCSKIIGSAIDIKKYKKSLLSIYEEVLKNKNIE